MSNAQSTFRDHVAGGFGWRERSAQPNTARLPLVCLHGIGSEARAFDTLARHLPADMRVIAWEAPGYGPSAPLTQDWPVATDYADALGRLADSLGLERFFLLGHSLGTLIGAAFAVGHPKRLAGLALVSCAQGMGVAPGAPLPPKAKARIDDLATLGAAEFAHARAANLIHEPADNPALVAAVEAGMARVRQPGYGQAVRMLASADLAGLASKLTVPTCVIVGSEDIITPPAQSRAVWAALPATQRLGFHELPGTGHAAPQQAPRQIAGILSETLLHQEGAEP